MEYVKRNTFTGVDVPLHQTRPEKSELEAGGQLEASLLLIGPQMVGREDLSVAIIGGFAWVAKFVENAVQLTKYRCMQKLHPAENLARRLVHI